MQAGRTSRGGQDESWQVPVPPDLDAVFAHLPPPLDFFPSYCLPLRAGSLWGLGVGTLPALTGKEGWVLSETDHLGWGRVSDPREGVNHRLQDEQSVCPSPAHASGLRTLRIYFLCCFRDGKWLLRVTQLLAAEFRQNLVPELLVQGCAPQQPCQRGLQAHRCQGEHLHSVLSAGQPGFPPSLRLLSLSPASSLLPTLPHACVASAPRLGVGRVGAGGQAWETGHALWGWEAACAWGRGFVSTGASSGGLRRAGVPSPASQKTL